MIDINLIENSLFNCDCLDLMKRLPDKCIDLVLTDPPYRDEKNNHPTKDMREKGDMKIFGNKPSQKMFDEIFRISKNQIIWGMNNYIDNLKNTNCVIVWYKKQALENFSDCELCWTSFNKVSKVFEYSIHQHNQIIKHHPTQKPLPLFDWILKNYSKENDIIFDGFAGSGTTALACIEMNRKYICVEKDEGYYKIADKRIKDALSQGTLF